VRSESREKNREVICISEFEKFDLDDECGIHLKLCSLVSSYVYHFYVVFQLNGI